MALEEEQEAIIKEVAGIIEVVIDPCGTEDTLEVQGVVVHAPGVQKGGPHHLRDLGVDQGTLTNHLHLQGPLLPALPQNTASLQ